MVNTEINHASIDFMSKINPKISIIIPAFNLSRHLPDAIHSALSQTFTDIEVIVRDDASTDNTPDIIKPFLCDKRFSYIRNPINLGAVDNINKCFYDATGDNTLILGADDFLLPGALSKLLDALERYPAAEFAYGSYIFTDVDGKPTSYIGHPGHLPFEVPPCRDDHPDLLAYDHYINIGATLFRSKAIHKFGVFDRNLAIDGKKRFFRATDWDLLLRFSQQGAGGVFTNSPASAFRVHRGQSSNNDEYDTEGISFRETLVLLKKYLTPESRTRIAGREVQIWNQLQSKFELFKQRCNLETYQKIWEVVSKDMVEIHHYLTDLYNDKLIDAELNEKFYIIIVSKGDIRQLYVTLSAIVNARGVVDTAIVLNISPFDLGDYCRTFPSMRFEHIHLPGYLQSAALMQGVVSAGAGHVMFLYEGQQPSSESIETCRTMLADPGDVFYQKPFPCIRKHALLRSCSPGAMASTPNYSKMIADAMGVRFES